MVAFPLFPRDPPFWTTTKNPQIKTSWNRIQQKRNNRADHRTRVRRHPLQGLFLARPFVVRASAPMTGQQAMCHVPFGSFQITGCSFFVRWFPLPPNLYAQGTCGVYNRYTKTRGYLWTVAVDFALDPQKVKLFADGSRASK